MGSQPIIKDLNAYAGPVARAFELNDQPVSVIIGPTGGGKTESSVRRIFRIARSQHPSPIDGIRKCRIVCVGNTYRDLWDKAIPSYLKVFNKEWGTEDGKSGWTGGKGDPATHIMDFIVYEPQPDGSVVEIPMHIEVWFRAKSGEQSLEDFVRGLECTAWWLQEMDQLDEAILSLTTNRVGRYPQPEDRWTPEQVAKFGWAAAFRGVWGDSNMPVKDSWLHNLAFRDKALGEGNRGLFMQPPALLHDRTENPRAENLQNLRKISATYYPDMAKNMEEYDVERLLMCKATFDRRGKAVYLLFSEVKHVTAKLIFDRRSPVIIGADTGNTLKNAAVFMQPSPNGRARVLREISPRDRQLTLRDFSNEILLMLSLWFPNTYDALLVVDPAAKAQMVDGTGGRAVSYWQFLQGLTGLDTVPAHTNDPGLRRTAGSDFLDKDTGMTISREGCPDLIASLGGGYMYRKIGNAWSPDVVKNDHSHVAEAWEYGCLHLNGASIFYGDERKTGGAESETYDQGPSFEV